MKKMSERGDKGMTSGECNLPEKKDSPFVEAMGAMDDFQAKLGWTRVKLVEEQYLSDADRVLSMEKSVSEIMGVLYQRIDWKNGSDRVGELDNWIAEYTKGRVKNLDGFLVPGENELESRLNLCRTSCRTAERRLVTLRWNENEQRAEDKTDSIIGFMNRASTYLFWLWQSKRD